MRSIFSIVIAVLAWVSAVNAQQLSIANITSCGLSCLLVTLPEANCSVTNTTCQCTSPTLTLLTSQCLIANCTMHDQLILSKVVASTCKYPHVDRSSEAIAMAAVIVSITSVLVIARLVSKSWVSSLGPEDWIIALALLLSFPSTYFTIKMAMEGFGKHLWDLNDGDLSRFLEHFYIAENIYVWDLALTKISVLVFYLRIFPGAWFRNATFATVGMITISTTIISLMTVFSCHPIPYFWDRDIRGGKCLNVNALAYANSAMSIIQDLTVVSLPLPVLVKLNMGRKKKIGVGIMFAVGSFGCVVSMIRLKSLLSFGNSVDPTFDYVNAVIWTILELAVAMICACLPAIRNLLVRLFPAAFQSSIGSSSNGGTKLTAGTWQGKFGSRNHLQRAEGFVELQPTSGTSLSGTAPKVPPKAQAVPMDTAEEDESMSRC